MSTFTAINLDKEEQDVEEHTREMQIELCLKLYGNALKHQKNKEFKEANEFYDQLFKIDVIKNDDPNNVNPTIENLKYIAYRNRGFLKLNQLIDINKTNRNDVIDQILQDNKTEKVHPKSEQYDLLISAVRDLIVSLQHGEGDYKSIQVLFKFFSFYKFKKLARFTLEYDIINNLFKCKDDHLDDESATYLTKNKTESKSISRRLLLPNEINILLQYYDTLVDLDDRAMSNNQTLLNNYEQYKNNQISKLDNSQLNSNVGLSDLITLDEFEELLALRREEEDDEKHYEIELDYTDYELRRSDSDVTSVQRFKWTDLIKELNDILPKQQKKSRTYDSYILSQSPIERLTFNINKLDKEKEFRKEEENELSSTLEFQKEPLEDEEQSIQFSKEEERNENGGEDEDEDEDEDEVEVEVEDEPAEENENDIKDQNEDENKSSGTPDNEDEDENENRNVESEQNNEDKDEDGDKDNNEDDKGDNNGINDNVTEKEEDKSGNIGLQRGDDDVDSKDENKDESKETENKPKRLLRNQRTTMSRQESIAEASSTLEMNIFIDQKKFKESSNNFLKMALPEEDCEAEERTMNNVFELLLAESNGVHDYAPSEQSDSNDYFVIHKLIKSIQSWKRSLSEALLMEAVSEETNSVNSSMNIRDVLYDSDMNKQKQLLVGDGTADEAQSSILELYSLILDFKQKNYHFSEIRMLVLESLMGTGENPILVSYQLDPITLSSVRKMIDACDISLYKKYEEVYKTSNDVIRFTKSQEVQKALLTSTCYLESLIDCFITLRKQRKLKLKTKLVSKGAKSQSNSSTANLGAINDSLNTLMNSASNSAQINDMITAEDILLKRINRWIFLINDFIQDIEDDERDNSTQLNVLISRFWWCQISLNQHQNEFDSEFIIEKLNLLSNIFESKNLTSDISMCNYDNIPALNLDNIINQLLKIKIFARFSNTSSNDSANNSKILEKLLFAGVKSSSLEMLDDDEQEMDQFISKSSIDLRLRLWQILLNQYLTEKSHAKYRSGFESVVQFIYEAVFDCFTNSDDYQTQSDSGGHVDFTKDQEKQYLKFFRLIGFFGNFTHHYLKLLQSTNWDTSVIQFDSSDEAARILKIILFFFNMFYSFLVHEEASKVAGSSLNSFSKISPSSSKTFKQLALVSGTLLCIYFEKSLDSIVPDVINDFISIIHEQLGVHKCCGLSNGIFLDYIQSRLIELCWFESDKDFFQCIYCKYGIQVSVGSFVPFDHGCQYGGPGHSAIANGSSTTSVTNAADITISKENALKLATFVVPYVLKKRNPLVYTPKSDMKSLIDIIADAIGEITEAENSNEFVKLNDAIVESYLSTTQLTLRLMKKAFYGVLELDAQFQQPELSLTSTSNSGLYYLQGIMALSLYKTRKKSVQGRMVELDFVTRILTQDLLTGSNRFETWIFLGQTYSFLVEDEIIWTSDKLTNEDKKIGTALLQKKALLCYLMAINIYAQMDDDTKRINVFLAPQLWTFFGKELYNSILEPMAMLAFSVNYMPLFVKRHGIKSFEKINSIVASANSQTLKESATEKATVLENSEETIANQENQERGKVILSLLRFCFQVAIQANPEDWSNYYYLSKVESKLNSSPELIVDSLLDSCRVALKSGSKDDPVIEPHYRLCSVVMKLVESKTINTDEALDIIQKDPMLALNEQDLRTTKSEICESDGFYKFIIALLKKVSNQDKKNWQHKPHYRMAKIYFEKFKEFEKAKKQMGHIINLKPNVRNLSTIWKPEAERPGKHFFYNYQYIVFYIDLLAATDDILQLFVMNKKLRRYGASMVRLLNAWEHSIAVTCSLTKKIAYIYEGFLDAEIVRLSYSKFLVDCERFIKYLETKTSFTHEEKLLFLFLSESNDLRRMANGFGTTSSIDECYHSLYLKLFLDFCSQDDKSSIAESSVPVDTILNTESPGPSSSKEKTKVARRDITPFGVRALKAVSDLISEITKAANEGVYLEYVVPEKVPIPDYALLKPAEDSPTKRRGKNDKSPRPERQDSSAVSSILVNLNGGDNTAITAGIDSQVGDKGDHIDWDVTMNEVDINNLERDETPTPARDIERVVPPSSIIVAPQPNTIELLDDIEKINEPKKTDYVDDGGKLIESTNDKLADDGDKVTELTKDELADDGDKLIDLTIDKLAGNGDKPIELTKDALADAEEKQIELLKMAADSETSENVNHPILDTVEMAKQINSTDVNSGITQNETILTNSSPRRRKTSTASLTNVAKSSTTPKRETQSKITSFFEKSPLPDMPPEVQHTIHLPDIPPPKFTPKKSSPAIQKVSPEPEIKYKRRKLIQTKDEIEVIDLEAEDEPDLKHKARDTEDDEEEDDDEDDDNAFVDAIESQSQPLEVVEDTQKEGDAVEELSTAPPEPPVVTRRATRSSGRILRSATK